MHRCPNVCRYTDTGFVVNNTVVEGPLLCLRSSCLLWHVENLADITPEALAPLLLLVPPLGAPAAAVAARPSAALAVVTPLISFAADRPVLCAGSCLTEQSAGSNSCCCLLHSPAVLGGRTGTPCSERCHRLRCSPCIPSACVPRRRSCGVRHGTQAAAGAAGGDARPAGPPHRHRGSQHGARPAPPLHICHQRLKVCFARQALCSGRPMLCAFNASPLPLTIPKNPTPGCIGIV